MAAVLLGPLPVKAEHIVAVVATEGSVHQPYGLEVAAGVEAAAARINGAGGVLGERIHLEIRREDCTRRRAIEAAGEVVMLKPVVVIGHSCAPAAMAAAAVYAKAGLLFIAPGVRYPALTRGRESGLVLRLAGREDRFAEDTSRFIAAHFSSKGVAVISDRTRQAQALADGLVAALERRNQAPRLDLRIESGEKDYRLVAGRVRESGAGAVVMPAQPIELGVLVQSLADAGVDVPIIGSEILAVPALTPLARQLGRNLIVMLPWTGLEVRGEVGDEGNATGRGGAPRSLLRDTVHRQAEAAMEVWAAAAQSAGTAAPSAVALAARASSAATVVGNMRFDAHGDALVPGFVPSTWQRAGWHPIDD